MMNVEVISSGMFTSIQDGGRIGMEAYGIPESGFLDQHAGRLANQLVGNSPTAALLEITSTGPTLHFHQDGFIAITGGDFNPTINGVPVPLNTGITINKGNTLKLHQALIGFRSYIAFKGKLAAQNVYESYSTHFQSEFGGFNGRALKKGDVLNISRQSARVKPTTAIDKKRTLNNSGKHIVNVFPGPETNILNTKEKILFSNHDFQVSNNSNRMGYRLWGKWTPTQLDIDTIISSGNVRGVVQLTAALEPIILLNDAGTTGGYPRIGICETPDLIAQVKPGEKIRFNWIEQ